MLRILRKVLGRPESVTIDGVTYHENDYDIKVQTLPGEGYANGVYSYSIPTEVTTVYHKHGGLVKRKERQVG